LKKEKTIIVLRHRNELRRYYFPSVQTEVYKEQKLTDIIKHNSLDDSTEYLKRKKKIVMKISP